MAAANSSFHSYPTQGAFPDQEDASFQKKMASLTSLLSTHEYLQSFIIKVFKNINHLFIAVTLNLLQ